MKKNKTIKEIIELTKDFEIKNPYHKFQFNLRDKNEHLNFQKYLISLSEFLFLEELSSVRRITTAKSLSDMLDDLSKTKWAFSGIKVIHDSIFKLYDWENWSDGYISGFCRFSGEDGKDYFIWTYIRMDKLEDILNNWIDKFMYDESLFRK